MAQNATAGNGGNGDAQVSDGGAGFLQAGSDSRIPPGGDGSFFQGNTNSFVGTNAAAYAGIVISSTTYLASSNYGRGGAGSSLSASEFPSGGPGVAILEPIA